MKTPQEATRKWVQNTAAAGEAMKEGVMAVTESPTRKAAARSDAYIAGVEKAVRDRKWQRGLERVSLEDWKKDMLEKGVPRVGPGVRAAEGKFQNFMDEFLPFVASGVASLPPRGTLEQNAQRAMDMIMHNAKFKRK